MPPQKGRQSKTTIATAASKSGIQKRASSSKLRADYQPNIRNTTPTDISTAIARQLSATQTAAILEQAANKDSSTTATFDNPITAPKSTEATKLKTAAPTLTPSNTCPSCGCTCKTHTPSPEEKRQPFQITFRNLPAGWSAFELEKWRGEISGKYDFYAYPYGPGEFDLYCGETWLNLRVDSYRGILKGTFNTGKTTGDIKFIYPLVLLSPNQALRFTWEGKKLATDDKEEGCGSIVIRQKFTIEGFFETRYTDKCFGFEGEKAKVFDYDFIY
ncbi:hypothetical protein AA313_de0200489 [Arthrobotrys entomopaga]|nr:hypothetical protein AA313_de0200489 [Arthrobotrys entomopaga]